MTPNGSPGNSTGHLNGESTKKSKGKNGVVIAAVVIAIVRAIIAVSVVLVLFSKGNYYSVVGIKICDTPKCRAAAAYYKSNMNLSADPCDDFFNYVCGGWAEKNKLVIAAKPKWSIYFSVYDQIKKELHETLMSSAGGNKSKAITHATNFYQACIHMNMSKEKKGLTKVLNKMGGFPLYVRSSYNKKMKWYQRLAVMYREFATVKSYQDGVLNWYLMFGIFIRSPNIIVLTAQNTLPSPAEAKSSKYKDLVHNFICNSMESTCTTEESQSMKKQIDGMVEFISKLTDLYLRYKDVKTLVLPEPLSHFNTSFPKFHMVEFLNTLFMNLNFTVDGETKIYFYGKYFDELEKLINATKPEVIDNTIGLFAILNFPLNFQTDETGRRDWCFQKTHESYPFVLSRLFIDTSFDVETKNIIVAKTEEMRKVFIDTINKNTWLDLDDKKDLINKMNALQIEIGFPEWIKLDRLLNAMYSLKPYVKNETVMENLSRFYSDNMNDYLKPLAEPPDTKDFFYWFENFPYIVNAVNNLPTNRITFTLGMYYSELYWPNTVKALEYSGSAMSVMGHELGHTVDDRGIGYDAKGNPRKLNDKLAQKFKERVNCFNKQYNSIFDPESQTYLNGNMTSGENIADSVSLRLVFKTYLKSGAEDVRLPGLEDISDKKLLFIASSMHRCARSTPEERRRLIAEGIHSLDKYRINIPALNFPLFAKVFNCGKGSYMNSQHKCRMW